MISPIETLARAQRELQEITELICPEPIAQGLIPILSETGTPRTLNPDEQKLFTLVIIKQSELQKMSEELASFRDKLQDVSSPEDVGVLEQGLHEIHARGNTLNRYRGLLWKFLWYSITENNPGIREYREGKIGEDWVIYGVPEVRRFFASELADEADQG